MWNKKQAVRLNTTGAAATREGSKSFISNIENKHQSNCEFDLKQPVIYEQQADPSGRQQQQCMAERIIYLEEETF